MGEGLFHDIQMNWLISNTVLLLFHRRVVDPSGLMYSLFTLGLLVMVQCYGLGVVRVRLHFSLLWVCYARPYITVTKLEEPCEMSRGKDKAE